VAFIPVISMPTPTESTLPVALTPVKLALIEAKVVMVPTLPVALTPVISLPTPSNPTLPVALIPVSDKPILSCPTLPVALTPDNSTKDVNTTVPTEPVAETPVSAAS
jgi:hypothetical protein